MPSTPRVCAAHLAVGINPDYGSCAPLHFADDRTTGEIRSTDRRNAADRLRGALAAYAEAHDIARIAYADNRERDGRALEAQGRARLHAYPHVLRALEPDLP